MTAELTVPLWLRCECRPTLIVFKCLNPFRWRCRCNSPVSQKIKSQKPSGPNSRVCLQVQLIWFIFLWPEINNQWLMIVQATICMPCGWDNPIPRFNLNTRLRNVWVVYLVLAWSLTQKLRPVIKVWVYNLRDLLQVKLGKKTQIGELISTYKKQNRVK